MTAIIVAAGIAGYVVIAGVVARVCGEFDLGEAEVPATLFWPVTLAVLACVALAWCPYWLTGRVIGRLKRKATSIPEARTVRR